MAENKPKTTATKKSSTGSNFLSGFGDQFKGVSKPMLEAFLNNLKMFSDSIETVEKNFDDLSKNAAPLFSYLNDKSGKNIVYYVYKPFLEQLKGGIDTLSKEIKKLM